jgi:hypothetical protein
MKHKIYKGSFTLTRPMEDGPCEKLAVALLVKKFTLSLIETEGSLPCSQKPATNPYYKPFESSTHSHTLFP